MIGKIGTVIVVGTALVLGSCQLGNKLEYSNGVRVGMINKFSKKGVAFKTYEGQMALEGIVSGGTSMGANVWNFSLDRSRKNGENTDELAKRITEYMNSGTKVRVNYTQPYTK